MIEVKGQRSARGAVFERGIDQDGNRLYTATNYAGDVHYDNWDGRGDGETGWRKVDIALAPDPAGWLVQYAPYVATIPLLSTGTLIFADKRNDAGKRKNMQWSLEVLGVAQVLGVLNGREVVYPDAFGPGAHLVYRAQRHGVAKLVRIDPTSAVTGPFVFRAHLPAGWKVVRQGDGGGYELLPTGKKELNTGKRTAFVGDGEETYAAPFMWRSGDVERGVLTVTAEHIGGNVWEITKAIPAEWSRESAIEMDVTATSTLSSDGSLWNHAATETYATKTTNTTATLLDSTGTAIQAYARSGSGGAVRYCIRGYAVFTNAVPGAATISEVRVKAYPVAFVALNGLSQNTNALAPFNPSNPASIAVGDYQQGTKMPNVVLATNTIAAADVSAGYKTWTITNASHIAAYVTKGGTDKWALREYSVAAGSEQTDLYYLLNSGTAYSSATAGYVNYNSSEVGSNPPVEEIDYTLPSAYQNLMLIGVG